MKRALVIVLFSVLATAWPVAVQADGERSDGVMTKLMILLSWRASHVVVPQQVVVPERDWQIVQDAQAVRGARERQLRDAADRIAERERDLRAARAAFRQETSRMVQQSQPSPGEDLQLAARRMSQREREAYQAKLEYSRTARELREQRRREAEAIAAAHT